MDNISLKCQSTTPDIKSFLFPSANYTTTYLYQVLPSCLKKSALSFQHPEVFIDYKFLIDHVPYTFTRPNMYYKLSYNSDGIFACVQYFPDESLVN